LAEANPGCRLVAPRSAKATAQGRGVPAERIIMAKALREKSSEETRNKSAEIMDVNATTVEQAFIKHNTRLMIHGHTHRPNIHTLVVNKKPATRIVLGDWYTHGSYLEFNGVNDYKLLTFQ